MPTYDYRCSACSETFEVDHKIFEEPKVFCPKCGAEARRLISRTSFVLRGKGWGADGYAEPPPKEKKA